MANENTTQTRIAGYIESLKAAGVSIPDETFDLPPRDIEKALKVLFDKAKTDGKIAADPIKPIAAEPTKPNDERNAPFAGVVPQSEDERIANLERQLKEAQEQSRAMYAKMDEIVNAAKNNGKSTAEALQDPGVIAALRSIQHGRTTEDGSFREGYVPPEDRLEQPVTIFCNKSGVQIWHRTENGMRIGLPEGMKAPLTFKKLWRVVDPQTLKMSVRYFMVIENRRLLEFMRKHENFGKEFFESENEAIRSDAGEEWSNSYQRYSRSLANLPEHKVIAQASALGLPTNAAWPGSKYVEMVAKHFADEEFMLKHQSKFDKMREMAAQQLLKETGEPVAQTA